MALETWFLFALAMTGLALAPGPNGLLALSHGLLYGHRQALFTVLGGVSGFILLMAVSVLGVGAIMQTHGSLLMIMKTAGALYLTWLGLKLWKTSAPEWQENQASDQVSRRILFRQGSLTALANPKVTLVFAAFIPQFIDPTRSLLSQLPVMILTFAACEFMVEYTLTRIAHWLRPWLSTRGKIFNQCCGSAFILIALLMTFEQLV
ncbi:LysE family transporter [Kistimonas scapharcae]|uniref:LysE family transporter n=1 Tax=Kistimonas scapharcae TaxID=1036133 RepID=A0ABP8V7E8_9GAMM